MKRWQIGAAAAAVVALASVVIGQTRIDTFPGKVAIRSTDSDALSVAGRIASASSMSATSSNPLIYLIESDASANNKRWRLNADSATFALFAEDDAASPSTAFSVTRSGGTPALFTVVPPLAVGSGSTAITKILSGTATWDPNNLTNTDGFDSVLVTVTGVTSGSPCFASFTASLGVNITLQARYDTTNTARVILNNHDTGGAYDPGSGTVRVTCFVY